MSNTVVVIGASVAGAKLVADLLQQNSSEQLSIVLIDKCEEPYFDKPPLSKEVLQGASRYQDSPLLSPEQLSDSRLSTHFGLEVTGLDIEKCSVQVANGTSIKFDQLVIATGAEARNIFRTSASNIFTLRTHADAVAIREALNPEDRIGIIGAGFIGMEAASHLSERGIQCTVIEAEEFPLSRIGAPALGHHIIELARAAGTRIRTGVGVQDLLIDDNHAVEGLQLSDGTEVECDAVLVAIGATPKNDWLQGQLPLEHGGIACDRYGLVKGTQNVYAIGDTATWDRPGKKGLRQEHWSSAIYQAGVVSQNLTKHYGDGISDLPDVNYMPYVWSDQFATRISMFGDFDAAGEEIVDDDRLEFASLYKDATGAIIGAAVVGQPAAALQYRRLVLNARS